MNKQRKVLITITYNEMGIITDTKAEEVAKEVDEAEHICGIAIVVSTGRTSSSRQTSALTVEQDGGKRGIENEK